MYRPIIPSILTLKPINSNKLSYLQYSYAMSKLDEIASDSKLS